LRDIVKRTTLIVRDAERAANWYADVFRMTRWLDTPFTLSGNQLAAGAKGDKTRLIIMQAAHDEIGMIGLLEWLEPKMEAPAEPATRIAFGAPIFVVAAHNAVATCARAKARGSHIHCEPIEWTVTGADGRLRDMIGASFFDLDGYFFEVNQLIGIREQ
jgi:catechol 2,3-dioxygenase-like lactoylglutathione lyase family enzyme